MDIFTQFILDHEHDDTGRLLLNRGKRPDIDMDLAVHTIEGRRRMRAKMPQWHSVPGLRYPTRLCTEQCSSAATARYKAALAARILSGDAVRDHEGDVMPDETKRPTGNIADLTGGLGVDAWAFSHVAKKVLHNEMDPLLSEAVRQNFTLLGVSNVIFRNACAAPGRIAGILEEFHPGLIFLDPARRAGDGRKVFRLEDCQPDILTLEDELLRHAPHLLLKISPMADISLIVKQLNNGEVAERMKQGQVRQEQLKQGKVREVHVVEAEGECKELLIWIDRDWNGPFRIIVCNADRMDTGQPGTSRISSWQDAESRAIPQFVPGPETLCGALLFEPGKALSKAGLFNTLCDGTGLLKLSRHTHLYLVSPAAPPPGQDGAAPQSRAGDAPAKGAESDSPGRERKEYTATALSEFGKLFRIIEVHPLSGKTLKAVGKAWPRADVTAKDLPLSSDELRKRLGVISDAAVHIFGCRVTGPAASGGPGRSGNSRTTKDGAPKDPAFLIVSEPVTDA